MTVEAPVFEVEAAPPPIEVHEETHEELGFLRRYVFSTDHKIIGIQYILLALTSVTCKAKVRAAACVTRAKCQQFSMAVTRTPRR